MIVDGGSNWLLPTAALLEILEKSGPKSHTWAYLVRATGFISHQAKPYTNPCTVNVDGVAANCAEPKSSVLVTLMQLLIFSRWSEEHQNREQSVERR